ncbi:MAG: hypothetical protein H0U42_09480 [Thermoleophilaceae bacterium]|nr:hypothetical protein [Thermoleophilaceae bacterium]
MSQLPDRVRADCAQIAASAESVSIHLDRLAAVERGPAPSLDPECHFLEGTREEVASYLLTLGAINFGSGWFPTLHKRPQCSGYFTIAWALTDRFRAVGSWSPAALRELAIDDLAGVLGQDREHELVDLYARALRELGGFLGDRRPIDVIEAADGSAVRLAQALADGLPTFRDPGFWKRAQIISSDLGLAGVATFGDLDRLTIFADNLVPHVLRVDGVLSYAPDLAARIDAGDLLPPGREEREIRACAVHACVALAERLGVSEPTLDNWLWNRGQEPRYKAIPRHRTRTTAY